MSSYGRQTFAQDAVSKYVLSAHSHILPSAAHWVKAGLDKFPHLTEMSPSFLSESSQIFEDVKHPGCASTLVLYRVGF